MAKSDSRAARFEERMAKSYGPASLRRGGAATVYDPISTGILELDLALGVGGYVPGKITQIWGPPDSGKLLDVDTPIPTPEGWTTMGNLNVGDWVFDRYGKPCRVVWTSPVDREPDARRVHFGNGVTLDACVDHQWVASTTDMRRQKVSRNGKPMDPTRVRVVTTGDMERAGVRVEKGKCCRWAVPMHGALALPEAELPVPPYTLGYWLGNGTTSAGHCTVNTLDVEHVYRMMTEEGFAVRTPPSAIHAGSTGLTPLLLLPLLREAGVLGRKHIPDVYLRASIQQRKALLAGLMDSDGSVSKVSPSSPMCSIDLSDKELFEDVRELVLSLGIKASSTGERMGSYSGIQTKISYRMSFSPDFNPFWSPRKAAQWLPSPTMRPSWRYVESIEALPDPPAMRCIQVDSPDSTYLAGSDMVVTHNTSVSIMGLAQAQMKYPNKMVAFIDVENKWDDKWAETLGVDRSRCYLFRPPTAEDTADMVKDCLASGLMSMVAIDSVGAMMGRIEQEKQADEATVAIVARIVTRMVKHITSLAPAQNTAVLICNQVRQDLSSMGAQVLPGGWALRHANAAQIRLRASTRSDDVLTVKRDGQDVPVGRKIAARIERNKMAPAGVTAFFTFINQASEAYGPVGVDPGSQAASIGERFGLVERSGAWYTLSTTGERFQGLERLRQALRADPESVAAIRSAALESLRSVIVSEPSPEDDVEQTPPPALPGVPPGVDVLVVEPDPPEVPSPENPPAAPSAPPENVAPALSPPLEDFYLPFVGSSAGSTESPEGA